MGEQSVALKDHVDVALVGGNPFNIDTVEQELPFVQHLETCNGTHDCGLATSRRTEERKELAGTHGQINAVDGGDPLVMAPIPLARPAQLDGVRLHWCSQRGWPVLGVRGRGP